MNKKEQDCVEQAANLILSALEGQAEFVEDGTLQSGMPETVRALRELLEALGSSLLTSMRQI